MKQRNVVKTITVAAVFMLMAMLVGCFGGGPSDDEIKQAVLLEMSGGDSAADIAEAEKLRTVINFNVSEKTKTDDTHYTIKASYDMQFNMSFDEFRMSLIKDARAASNAEKLEAITIIAGVKDSLGEFKKDELFHKEIEVVFAKTDKGWKMANTTE